MMECTPNEDAVKTAEMKTKDLEYYIKLVIKQWQGLRELTPKKDILLRVKCYQTVLRVAEKSLVKGSQLMPKLHFFLV